MENTLAANVHQPQRSGATAKKKTKKKKNPIKVVYISNPKKFNTSATEFMALVQELTGKDSDPTKFEDPDCYDVGDCHHQTEDQPPPLDNIAGSKIDGGDDDDDQVVFSLDPTTTAESPDPSPPPPPPALFAEPFDEYHNALIMPPHHHQTYENNISGFLFSDFSHVDLIYEELMQCK